MVEGDVDLPGSEKTTMNAETQRLVRITGIAAMIAGMVYAISDMLLLAGKADPANFPILAQYGDVIDTDIATAMLPLSTARLAWGALLGVLIAPLEVAGSWHVYQGLKPAGKWLALPPFLFLFYATVLGPFAHGSFFYLGEILKTLSAVDPSAQEQLLGLYSHSVNVLAVGWGTTMLLYVVGWIWFAVAVFKANSFYPRWMAILNVIVLALVIHLISYVLPESLSLYLHPAGGNLGAFIFFAVSTVLLWNGKKNSISPI